MSPEAEVQVLEEKYVPELGQIEDAAGREAFLQKHPELVRPEVVRRLAEIVVRKVRVDRRESLHLADAAIEISRMLDDRVCLAFGLRAKANALYMAGENRAAVAHHEQAFEIFESLGEWNEAGRTLSASLQPLILLGEYDRAFAAAGRAREIFTRLNLPWRLARLDINVGNIFHRQDRFDEALEHYERAYAGLMPHQDAEGMAVILGNMAACLISLNDFPQALASHERARQVSQENGMPLLVAQADYNIAYLYYLRGEYSRAIEMLYAARQAWEASGDHYHHALCQLDLSEIYLELNLSEEARQIAREGYQRFEKLGMAYEAAKTLVNEAIALGQQGKDIQALEGFGQARGIFEREKNLVWPWLLDLYQALLLFRKGRYLEARRQCTAAAGFFDSSVLSGKAVLAHLLLARIAMQMDQLDAAQRETHVALERLKSLQAPALTYQAYFVLGQIAQARADTPTAYSAYQEARKALESLRSRLQGEELKIAFAQDRMQVYESLVELCMGRGGEKEAAREAFEYMESAKSRSMVEAILPGSAAPASADRGQSGLVRRIRDLREELNWYYHRIELEQLRPGERSRERIEKMQEQAQARENELLRVLREIPAREREGTPLPGAAEFSLERIQCSLPADASLVEFYSAGERIFAAVLTSESIEVIPVTVRSRVGGFLELLRFQFAKFRLGAEYMQRFSEPLLRATQGHLASLYAELLAPLRPLLQGTHLIVVPHGPLHYLPFHALLDGEEYLCDRFTVSYAPSATMFALCQERPAPGSESSLVLGVPDERAPEILREVQEVAGILPRAELCVGERATAALLREKGPASRFLHIATHGIYRQDNPMFSAIRLGDGYLNLYDLYQMRLGAELVALSGCATGMNVVAAGDELLGLERGLFHAGAASLMLSLWDVHDRTTAELMHAFYSRYIRTGRMAEAMQGAMWEIRERHPHPYFWAPFVLVGKVAESKDLN